MTSSHTDHYTTEDLQFEKSVVGVFLVTHRSLRTPGLALQEGKGPEPRERGIEPRAAE